MSPEVIARRDRFEGRSSLDWWANPVICLASVEIMMSMAVTDKGWAAEGRLVNDSDDEREGFAFLLDMDPVFTLTFDDESTIEVTVHPNPEGDRFTLTEYAG